MCLPSFVGVLCLFLLCITLCPFLLMFAIILKKRKLVALLLLSYRCQVTVIPLVGEHVFPLTMFVDLSVITTQC